MSQSTYMVFNHMPFSDLLSALRKQRGLTQEALSDLIGVTKTQVYRYENGRSQPPLNVSKHLALALSVTTDQLIFEEGDSQPHDSLSLLLEGITRLDPVEKH